MSTREAREVAARLARMHSDFFSENRGNKMLRISKEVFYRIARRQRLSTQAYKEIADALFADQDLILGRATWFFILVPINVCLNEWPELQSAAAMTEDRKKPPQLPLRSLRQ